MMGEQLNLIEGVRLEPPACFDIVAEAIETALGNGQDFSDWADADLARDLELYAGLGPEHSAAEIERAIRIYRERMGGAF